jgi:hypothetical protein
MEYKIVPTDVLLHVDFCDDIEDQLKKYDITTDITDTTLAITVYYDCHIYCVFLTKRFNEQIAVHESVHAAMRMLEFLGIKAEKAEELLAYYTDYIYKLIMENRP